MTKDYFIDRSHILIMGTTGARTKFGGKTALANWWASTHGRRSFDIVIFYNPKQDSGPESAAETVVSDCVGLIEAVSNGCRHICLTPRSADWSGVHEHLLSAVRYLPKDWTKLVVHDEAPELSSDVLKTFVRVEGNGSKTKSLVVAQDPAALSNRIRTQLIPLWVGPISDNNRGVFRVNNRESHFEYIQQNHEPYEWSILLGPDDDDRDTFDPVPEKFA